MVRQYGETVVSRVISRVRYGMVFGMDTEPRVNLNDFIDISFVGLPCIR